LDILVVAFLSYRVLLFFADTRAMQLARGLFVVVVFGLIARAMELRAIMWLLSHLLSAVIITVPIVFQPELRRLLEAIGRGGIPGRRAGVDDISESYAEAVINALAYLRRHRIGALVIFQRDTGLGEIWRSAVHLRAEITYELIISIFWPNNPLHDGAVIMDKRSVTAAACYLPLTDNDDISRWYGTRHRAAVGVTEVSDAQALVVSEERGKISLAVRGKLSQLNDDQVSRFVRRYFKPYDENIGPLQRLKREMKRRWPSGVR
jgi:diadenylate cyclase